jgi:DNA-binding SARP family transcriptional activator/predicted ATPase
VDGVVVVVLLTNEKPSVARLSSDAPRPTRIAVTLLGTFTVSVNGAPIAAERWKFKHPRLLWQMLCLAPGHCVSRDQAAEALWPQATVQASSNRLYHTLHTLRGIFGDAGLADARQLVQLQAGTLRLDPALALDIDVQRFAQAVAEARACNGSDTALAALERAQAIQAGELALPAAAGGWFTLHRQALLRDRVWLLEQLVQRYEASGRIDDAVQVAQVLVEAEPTNEAAHLRLIEIYGVQGRADLAAQQYTLCSRRLRRELGLEPSPATRQAAERIAAQAVPRAAQASSGAADATSRQRFVAPPRVTPLLGREAELGELQRWLRQDNGARLITIAAAGGIGKTRLAAALAEQVQDDFADGVQFIALGDVQRPSRLAEHVCQALGLSSAEQSADQRLPAALASRHQLLVLDRFEHLIEAAPQLALWLQAAPRLHIVVTSQCPLKSRAERVYELLPLSAYAPQAAVELFIQTAARTGAVVQRPDDEATIGQVCAQVGGNALAIELAAAQLGCVALADLPAALHQPLQWPPGTAPDNEPQHTSLQATVDWSVSLLAPGEARLLALLGVFAGDFDAAQVQSVCAFAFDDGALPPMLRNLIDRHLLFRRAGSADEQGGLFAMADPVREHARCQVAAMTEGPQAFEQHARHFLARAQEATAAAKKGDSNQAIYLVRASVADLEQALAWTRRHADLQTWLQLSWMSALFHLSFGSHRIAVDLLDAAIKETAHTPAERHFSARCHVLSAGARALQWDHAAMMKLLRRARDLAVDSTDEDLLHKIDYLEASVRLQQLRPGAADKVARRMIDRATRSQHADHAAAGYVCLVTACQFSGDYRRARDAAEQAIAMAQTAQAPTWMVLSHCVCAGSEISLGDLERAKGSLQDALQLNRVARRPSLEFHLHLHSSVLAFEQGDFDDCMRQLQTVRALCESYVPRLAIVADLWREFVLIERGHGDGAVVLNGLTARDFPFDSDFANTYACSLKYRLQLLATRREWAAAQDVLQAFRQLLRRTGNRLWASWAAESAVVAAQHAGRIAWSRRFLELSSALQASAGTTATPRQRNSWSRLEAGLQGSFIDASAPADEGFDAALASLLHDLGAAADASLLAVFAVPHDDEIVAAGP